MASARFIQFGVTILMQSWYIASLARQNAAQCIERDSAFELAHQPVIQVPSCYLDELGMASHTIGVTEALMVAALLAAAYF